MYDEECHVRVRIVSSHNMPVDFNKCEVSNVEQDEGYGVFKASTYVRPIESVKSGLSDLLFA